MALILTGIMAAVPAPCIAQPAAPEGPTQLVREVVYNELQDHDRHNYWRYWVEHHAPDGIRVEEEVETASGPIARLILANGHRLDAQTEQQEMTRLRQLENSPAEQASRRRAFEDDEKQVKRILVLLPDAFVFQDAGEESGCRHFRYAPNPNYSAHTVEARVFHQLSGDLWIDIRMKRMKRLEGRLNDNVEFGMGLLGRVNKGGWFRMVRTQVSANEWKTERLEVHMSGRALMFKTLARDENEVRGGFEAVPASMSVKQGMQVLQQSVTEREAALAQGRISPAALVMQRRETPRQAFRQ
ncbi:MAG TPA: hypothetical protein VG225_00945 [Terracidiphilus sp.]|jgi:hypothetical protein|nr:hypothetical protein [Terracidiphilus sp.]